MFPLPKKQTEIIKDIVERFPDSIQMLEYEDYMAKPTAKNASEFIARALEDNAHNVLENTTCADYIATRKGVEKHGSHGLFSGDAERLGYNNA